MSTQPSHQRSRHWMATWPAGPHLGRLATVLAAVISGLLASAAPARRRSRTRYRSGTAVPPVRARPPTVRVVSTAGMAGWQIALIAAGAALVTAAAAVLLDRKLARRRALAATA